MPRDPRYKMPAGTRKFGKKVFKYLEWRKLKSEAGNVAERWRKKGYDARIVKAQHGYAIYIRR